MLGDGLNDAGALMQSDVGVAISEDTASFSPACDAIMDASAFRKLEKMIRFSKNTKTVIVLSFIISVIYNLIGVTIAFQSAVSPMVAAILMPLSSVSVVLFTVLTTDFTAREED
jgi:Cu+-exporting ATPase